jgi:hypothetical protein
LAHPGHLIERRGLDETRGGIIDDDDDEMMLVMSVMLEGNYGRELLETYIEETRTNKTTGSIGAQ